MRPARYFLFLSLFLSAVFLPRGWAAEPFVIVELFTSQGCSSCPSAEQVFHQLAKEAKESGSRIYFLSFHIDYWDHLGWKDPFSSPEFTKRQYKYANVLGANSTYTPQMIINGRQVFVGSDRGKAKRFIKIYLEVPATNELTLNVAKRDGKRLEVFYQCDRLSKGSVIHFALTQSGLKTNVTAGENRGRIQENDGVVRVFETVTLNGQGSISLDLPEHESNARFELIAYIQDVADMRIYAAERIELD